METACKIQSIKIGPNFKVFASTDAANYKVHKMKCSLKMEQNAKYFKTLMRQGGQKDKAKIIFHVVIVILNLKFH